MSADAPDCDETPASERSGPMTGIRVIELGSTVAGPFCARLMADFGADVIKVEQPEGDAVRSMGTRKDGRSLYGASIFRNKRLAAIDLRSEEGRSLARDLCLSVDIVVENFRPGTLEKWGLGHEALSAENPGLIMVRISGFGQEGPYSGRGGYGVVGEAVSGLREITGDPDRPPPRVNTSMADYCAGLYGAFGAVMALLERSRTGKGQVVDATLLESSFSFMEPHVPAFQQLGFAGLVIRSDAKGASETGFNIALWRWAGAGCELEVMDDEDRLGRMGAQRKKEHIGRPRWMRKRNLQGKHIAIF